MFMLHTISVALSMYCGIAAGVGGVCMHVLWWRGVCTVCMYCGGGGGGGVFILCVCVACVIQCNTMYCCIAFN